MKARHLIVLAVVLVALVALRWLVGGGDQVAEDLESAGVRRVLPAELDVEEVRWIKVEPGEGGEVLEARREGDDWVVASAHGARADEEAVESFLERLDDMVGEPRAEGEALADEFGVDESAMRLELGRSPGQADAVLLLGKTGDAAQAHFVRVEGQDEILHAARGLKTELGLRSEGATLASDRWVDKQVLELEQDDVASIELDRADVRYRLVAEEDPPEEDTAEEQAEGPEQDDWRVLEPVLPWSVRSYGPSGLAGRLARLRATSVLDPEEATCSPGAEAPRLRLTMEDGTVRELTFGTERTAQDEVGVRLDGTGPCYGLSKWSAGSLLPKASQVWDVPRAFDGAPTAKDVESLVVERGGEELRLERDDEDEWRLVSPEAGEADGSRVSRLVSALLALRLDDVAVRADVPEELLEREALLTASAGEESFTVEVLGPRAASAGDERYVRIGGGGVVPEGFVGVVAGTTADSLLAQPSELRAGGSS